jgi:peptide/nickel transport system permease protein
LIITWIYSVFSSIPYIVLVLLIAAVVRAQSEVILPVAAVLGLDPGLIGLYLAFSLTFWIGPARVVRGEVMKIKEMEYVQAARALGNSRMRILFRHVLPNTMHLIFVYFSLIFIGAIKSEVILTFLGLGVKNMPSWGGMISDASKEIIGGIWWQMIGASLALFLLVYAFNIFTDALQDALDPKHIK